MARVLVIDDNSTNLELMLYLLKAFGHEATGLPDGWAGLESAKRDGYDIILSDLLMPGLDGYQLASTLKADPATKPVPLIAVTALAMVGDRKRALDAGFDGYVAKPIDPEKFVSQIEAFLPERMRSRGPEVHEPSAAAAPPPASGPVVLVIDDMQVNLQVVRSALEPLGYRVADAQYPAQAMELARSVRPALILCDVHMPGFDGFDVLAQVSADAQLRTIPFIFLSSTSTDPDDSARGLAMGARRFLLRPIEPAQLATVVDECLRETQRG
ncbi:MAG TPA: response regulator [Candidatus Eremiobacteraceae bacterium]|nr:response regulator [Candidatus Eremiobacteraceae bacterium]